MYAARSRGIRLKLTWDVLKSQTAIKEQSSSEQLYRLERKRVHLVNNRRARSAFFAIEKGLFQVSTFVLCNSFGVSDSLKACFVEVLAQWLLVRETPDAEPAIINAVLSVELESDK